MFAPRDPRLHPRKTLAAEDAAEINAGGPVVPSTDPRKILAAKDAAEINAIGPVVLSPDPRKILAAAGATEINGVGPVVEETISSPVDPGSPWSAAKIAHEADEEQQVDAVDLDAVNLDAEITAGSNFSAMLQAEDVQALEDVFEHFKSQDFTLYRPEQAMIKFFRELRTRLSLLHEEKPNLHLHIKQAPDILFSVSEQQCAPPEEFAFSATTPKITFKRDLVDSGHPLQAIKVLLMELQALMGYKEFHGYSAAWAIIVNDAERQAHPSYPLKGPNPSALAKKAHFQTQGYLYTQLLGAVGPQETIIYNPQCNPSDYHIKLVNGTEKWPWATYLLRALLEHYDPSTPGAHDKVLTQLDAHLNKMPVLTGEPASLSTFQTWLGSLSLLWDKVKTSGLRSEQEMVRLSIRQIKNIKYQAEDKVYTGIPTVDYNLLLTAWTVNRQPPASMADLLRELKEFAKENHADLPLLSKPPAAFNTTVSTEPGITALNTQLQVLHEAIDKIRESKHTTNGNAGNADNAGGHFRKVINCDLCGGKHDVLQCRQYHAMKKQRNASTLPSTMHTNSGHVSSNKQRKFKKKFNNGSSSKGSSYNSSSSSGFSASGTGFVPPHNRFHKNKTYVNPATQRTGSSHHTQDSAHHATVRFNDVALPPVELATLEFTGHVLPSSTTAASSTATAITTSNQDPPYCVTDSDSAEELPDLIDSSSEAEIPGLIYSSSDPDSDEELYNSSSAKTDKRAASPDDTSANKKAKTLVTNQYKQSAPAPLIVPKRKAPTDPGYDGDLDLNDKAHDQFLSQKPGYPVSFSAAGMARFKTATSGTPTPTAHTYTCSLCFPTLTKCQSLLQSRPDLTLKVDRSAALLPPRLPSVSQLEVTYSPVLSTTPSWTNMVPENLASSSCNTPSALTCAFPSAFSCQVEIALGYFIAEISNKISLQSELSATCPHIEHLYKQLLHLQQNQWLPKHSTEWAYTISNSSEAIPQPPRAQLPNCGLIVDSGTSKHIVHSHDYILNSQPHNVFVAGFAGAHSRSTHIADLAITVRTSTGHLHSLIDPATALILPDARNNLLSVRCLQKQGHEVTLGATPGLLLNSDKNTFVSFSTCPVTGLWLLPCLPHISKSNGLYAMQGDDVQEALKDTHRALGHISFKRMRDLNIEGQDLPTRSSKRLRPALTCPTCITAKMRRQPTPASIASEPQFAEPWAKIFVDLSGKVKTRSVTGVHYFVVFICNYSGAKYTDFLVHKNDFLHAYKRFIAHLQLHPKQIRILHTDLGGEFQDKRLATYLEDAGTQHRMCSKNEHHEIGPAENAIGTLRTTAKCLMLEANVWKRFWPFAIGHATYLSNLTSKSRADRHLTPYELLFQQKADLSKVPPFGCYAASFRDRRTLTDQSFDLTSSPGIFIGINRHNKNLGYCLTDGHKVWVTRNHISFDRHFFPLTQKAHASSPAWATYHNLVHFQQKSTPTTTSPSDQDPLELTSSSPVNRSDDNSNPTNPTPNCTSITCPCPVCRKFRHDDNTWNDAEPCRKSVGCKCPSCRQFYDASGNWNEVAASQSLSRQPPQDSVVDNEASSSSSDEEQTAPTATAPRPQRSAARHASIPTELLRKSRQPKPRTEAEKRYQSDSTYRAERDSHVGKPIQRFFASHARLFNGHVTEYHCSTDTYSLLYEDDDQEVVSYDELLTLLPNSPSFTQQNVCAAIVYALNTACVDADIARKQQYCEPLTYAEALAAADAPFWIEAMQTEIKKLEDLNCWTVVHRNDLPPNAAIMKSRWVFKYKTDEHGNLTDVGRRARIVAKGFTQIKDINYFETYSAVAHGNTIRFVFSLTALPGFQCWHFDVSVAFIQTKVDPNEPPIYVAPPPGLTTASNLVLLLNRLLYGMKQSGRGWSLLLQRILTTFGLTRLRSDEAVYILRKPNSPQSYSDCTHQEAILILVTYVDDILAFSNSALLVTEFHVHCNKTVKMNLEGICNWYLSVKYDRDSVTGAVTASQELYIKKLLQKYGLTQCNPLPVPFPARADTVLKDLDKPPKNPSAALKNEYQSLIGSLLYLQMHTVPEISYALSVLSRYLANPGETHLSYAKKILRYLKGRQSIPLRYCAQTCPAPYLPGHVYGYSDASFADIYPNRHSTIGYVFLVNGAAVSWRSKKSSIIALNTAEAELIAMSAAAQEAMYLRKLSNELGFLQTSPTILYQDNQAAVALSHDVRFANRSKHIALRFSYVAERQLLRDIDVVSVSRSVMLADIMATPRQASAFHPFRDAILGLNTAPVTLFADIMPTSSPSLSSSSSTSSTPPGTTAYVSCIECDCFFFAPVDAIPLCPDCLSTDDTDPDSEISVSAAPW